MKYRSASLGFQEITSSIWCGFFLYLCCSIWWWSESKPNVSKILPFNSKTYLKAHTDYKEALKLFSKRSDSKEQTGICVKSNSDHMRKGAQGPQLLFGATFMEFRRRSWGVVGVWHGWIFISTDRLKLGRHLLPVQVLSTQYFIWLYTHNYT